MTQGKMRHLPVVDDGKVLGLVSIGDLVNAQLAEQRFLIEQMENYIAGNTR
jgi:CBS domain-containing protein